MNKSYDEYELWFSDNAGNQIKGTMELVDALGDVKELYYSELMPRWKRNIEFYKRKLEELKEKDIKICRLNDEDYPLGLKEIHDPPYLIYYKGSLPDRRLRMSAVVGSRKASSYGRRMAFEIGKILALHGVAVVSGMALGADSNAHKGCLEAGGITAAVLGSGVDKCTPTSNLALMESIIAKGGCVLSEYLPGTPGYPYNYPRRNRIISGMCENVIVIEADERSGTSVTANMALEQGREVFALPGNIDSVMSRGTNRLIKEGAIPLISVENIIEEMNIPSRQSGKAASTLSEIETLVLKYIENSGAVIFDELCIGLGKSSYEIAGIVTALEIKGYILKNEGKIIIAK